MSTPLPPPPPPPWAAANPPGPEGSIPPSAQTPLPWPPGGPALPPPTYTTVSAPTRALAITALILALAGFLGVTAVAALVIGIVVLVRRLPGRALGVAAMVMSLLWLGGIYTFFSSSAWDDFKQGAVDAFRDGANGPQPDRDQSGQITEPTNMPAGNLKVGDCYRSAGPQAEETVEVNTVPGVPCNLTHAFEVYALSTIPDGAYPGDDVVEGQADKACTDAFEAFVGTSYDDSVLDVYYFFPTKSSWNLLRDRTITCSVSDGESTIGSLKGSKR